MYNDFFFNRRLKAVFLQSQCDVTRNFGIHYIFIKQKFFKHQTK